jgi:WD40 repeat protein
MLIVGLLVAVIMLLLRDQPAAAPPEHAANRQVEKRGPAVSRKAAPRPQSDRQPKDQRRLLPEPETPREPPPVWFGHKSPVFGVAFSPKSDVVISAGMPPDSSVYLWDFQTGTRIKKCLEKFTDAICSVAISPDGRYALIACGGYWKNNEYVLGTDFRLRLWDLETDTEMTASKLAPQEKKKIPRLEGHTNEVYSVAISRDGKKAVSGGRDWTVRIWDLKTGKELQCLRGHTNSIYQVAFSPDGRRVLSCGADQTARLWDVETGTEIRCLKGHTDLVWAVAFSPDGKYAITGAGQQLDLKNRSNGVPRFLPGTKDFTVRRWDLATGKEVQCFRGHNEVVFRVAPTPDGRRILSGSGDCTVRLWDIATGKEVCCYRGHNGTIRDLAVSPDGRYAASGAWDQTIRIWKLPANGFKP